MILLDSKVEKGEREGFGMGRDIIHLSWDTIEMKFYHIFSTWIVLWLTILILRVNYAFVRKINIEIPTLIFNITTMWDKFYLDICYYLGNFIKKHKNIFFYSRPKKKESYPHQNAFLMQINEESIL